MIEFRHIAIEGVPGSGKTAVARALAEQVSAKLLLDIDDNPFLEAFHEDMSALAFQTQIYFLLTRYRLEDSLRQPDLFSHHIITDYFSGRDDIYASITLGEDEMLMYRTLHSLLGDRRTPPDLVIYLQLSTQEALRRNSEVEQAEAGLGFSSQSSTHGSGHSRVGGIEPAFMRLLTDSYNDYFFSYSKTPLLIIKADNFDPVLHDGEMNELIRMINAHSERVSPSGDALYFTPMKAT